MKVDYASLQEKKVIDIAGTEWFSIESFQIWLQEKLRFRSQMREFDRAILEKIEKRMQDGKDWSHLESFLPDIVRRLG